MYSDGPTANLRVPFLTVDPPLPPGVDEADAFFALRDFPGFTQMFFFEHFYLVCYEDFTSAQKALEEVNDKLAAPMKIHWDHWAGEDPLNGPYPDNSPSVETSFIFLPRSFIRQEAIQKLTKTYAGFVAAKIATRGYIFKFKNIRSARACFSDLTETTSMLPFFCGPDGKPIAPRVDPESEPEVQSESVCTIWLEPIGDDLSVLMNFMSSFYGWKRIFCTDSIVVGIEFESSAAASRAMNYINDRTPAQAWWAPESFPFNGSPPTISPTPHIHIYLAGLRGKKIAGQRKLNWWVKSYAGTKSVRTGKHNGTTCLKVTFDDANHAAAALRDIVATTNFQCVFMPRVNDTCPVVKPQLNNVYVEKAISEDFTPTQPAAKPKPVPKGPQALHLTEAPKSLESATISTTPILCIRNLPPTFTRETITKLLSAFDGYMGLAIATSGAVFARFEDEPRLQLAYRAMEAYRRLLGDKSNAPGGRLLISTQVHPPARIAHELNNLRAWPFAAASSDGEKPLSSMTRLAHLPHNHVPPSGEFDPSVYFSGSVREEVADFGSGEERKLFEALRESVAVLKVSGGPVSRKMAEVEAQKRNVAYRRGGLERGLERVREVFEVVEEGGKEGKEKEKMERIEMMENLVGSAVKAALMAV
ncbi:hypothetical protein HDV00_000529 [Rhizophlyctis rosea]|nr:hypothetical protein HDV00_000529 [Rhizophlyctis rosea]